MSKRTLVATDSATRWKAWLPVPPLPRAARPTPTDVESFASVGVDEKRLHAALAVLRCVRASVLPAVAQAREAGLDGFQFLVHDPPKGVKSPKGSPGCVDLTLRFAHATSGAQRHLPDGWQRVERAEPTTEIAGVDVAAFQGGVYRAQRFIERQSAWYLDLVGSSPASMPDVALLRQVGQFLHFFANMSQLVVL